MSVKPFPHPETVGPSRGALSQVLTDSAGESYRLFITIRGDRHSLKLYQRSVWVGEARCSWQDGCSPPDGGSPPNSGLTQEGSPIPKGGCMVLDDIAIANQARPSLNLLERLQQLFGAEFEPVNYRQRGLGTLLLTNVIEHARKVGATSLRGEVFQADVENNPGLLNWYERQGFIQSAPQPDQLDVLANITLELRSTAQMQRATVADTLA